MGTATEAEKLAARLAAHRRLFESIKAAITQLEMELGVTPREVRSTGRLGEFVATASSAASEGLQLVVNAEQGRG